MNWGQIALFCVVGFVLVGGIAMEIYLAFERVLPNAKEAAHSGPLSEAAMAVVEMVPGPARKAAAMALTEEEMRSVGSALYPGLKMLKARALAEDPYRWIDPWTGRDD